VPFYEVGILGAAAATGAAYSDLHGATTGAPRIREFGAFCNAATASPGWLGRPANTPVATTNALGLAVNPDSDVASITNAGSAWSTAPTTPTIIYRRWNLPATIGAGIVFVWDSGEEILLSKTAGSNQWLIHWNPTGGATGSQHNTYWKWRE
jgi:hypothetical protein